MSRSLQEFIDAEGPRGRRSCRVCRNDMAAQQLDEFLDLKAAGKVHISVRDLLDRQLRPELGLEVCYDTVRNHIHNCLGRKADGSHR